MWVTFFAPVCTYKGLCKKTFGKYNDTEFDIDEERNISKKDFRITLIMEKIIGLIITEYFVV
jgi:hypothetical protein